MTVLVRIVHLATHRPRTITTTISVRTATPRMGGRMKRVTLTIARKIAPTVTVAHQVTGLASARIATAPAAGVQTIVILITLALPSAAPATHHQQVTHAGSAQSATTRTTGVRLILMRTR